MTVGGKINYRRKNKMMASEVQKNKSPNSHSDVRWKGRVRRQKEIILWQKKADSNVAVKQENSSAISSMCEKCLNTNPLLNSQVLMYAEWHL